MLGRWLSAAVLLAALLSPPSFGQGEDGSGAREDWIATFVPRMESPRAQLQHARRVKAQMVGKEGADLEFWRTLAVEAYQAVRVFHPGAREVAAEAAFRAGELLRAGDRADEALAEFRFCLRQAGRTDFKARAGLEIGHLERRRRAWREALDTYLAVAADASARARRREDAWLWAGRVWKEQGRVDDARTAWKRVAEEGTDALLRVRAFDELGLLALANDDVEAAAGWLERCLRALSAAALEETEEGERVRDALLRMRLVDELTRAIERGKDSSADEGTSRNP